MADKSQEQGRVLRTILKPAVYDRLEEFAKRYSTGRGDWDFGVAIEILLDMKDESKVVVLNDKMDMILSVMTSPQSEPEQPPETVELLGGHKELKGEK